MTKSVAKKKTAPAKAPAKVEVKIPVAKGSTLTVSEVDQKALREANTALGTSKIALANIVLQEEQLRTQKAELTAALFAADLQFKEQLNAAAIACGVDLKEPWGFDYNSMTFTKA